MLMRTPNSFRPVLIALSLVSSLFLTACGGSDSDSSGGLTADDRSVDATEFCLTTDCGQKQTIAQIPDAENMIFSEDGRLFVSGNGLYEVTRDEDGTFSTHLINAAIFHGGLAIVGDVLYVNDPITRQLRATRIAAREEMDLLPIHTFVHAEFANGLQAGPDGELYVADGPFVPMPLNASISRLTIDPQDPFRITDDKLFLSFFAANLPDGMAVQGRTLYFTDTRALTVQLGLVRAVEILRDGTAGEIVDVVSDPLGLFDEINIAGDYLFYTDFLQGRAVVADRGGRTVLESALLAFEQPSALLPGRPPMFKSSDLLVTEKGLPIEGITPIGNSLVVYRSSL